MAPSVIGKPAQTVALLGVAVSIMVGFGFIIILIVLVTVQLPALVAVIV